MLIAYYEQSEQDQTRCNATFLTILPPFIAVVVQDLQILFVAAPTDFESSLIDKRLVSSRSIV